MRTSQTRRDKMRRKTVTPRREEAERLAAMVLRTVSISLSILVFHVILTRTAFCGLDVQEQAILRNVVLNLTEMNCSTCRFHEPRTKRKKGKHMQGRDACSRLMTSPCQVGTGNRCLAAIFVWRSSLCTALHRIQQR